MRQESENTKKILLIIVFTCVLIFLLLNAASIWRWICKATGCFTPLFTGCIIAFFVNILLCPIERLWTKLFKKQRRISSALKRPVCLVLALITVAAVIFAFLFIIVPELASTFMSLIERMPGYISAVKDRYDALAQHLSRYSVTLPELSFNDTGLLAGLSEHLKALSVSLPDMVINGAAALFSTAANAVIGIVFAVYLLLSKELLARQLRQVFYAFCRDRQNVDLLFRFAALLGRTFADFLSRQVLEAGIMGMLCLAGTLIIGIPYAPVLAAVVGFSALIPMFGAFVGTVLGALIVLAADPFKALLFVVFIVILQQIEGNFIYPHVVGSSVGLSPIWVLSAVTVGGAMFGVAGMLVSVPLTSVVYFTVADVVKDRLNKKSAAHSDTPDK